MFSLMNRRWKESQTDRQRQDAVWLSVIVLLHLRTSKLPQKDSPLLPVKSVHCYLHIVNKVSCSVWSFTAPIAVSGTKLLVD